MSQIFEIYKIQKDHFKKSKKAEVFEKETIEMTIDLTISVSNSKTNIIKFTPQLSFAEKEKKFIDMAVSTFFKIEMAEWRKYLSDDKKYLTLPLSLTIELFEISIGIVRGYLVAKTENKGNYIFPFVDSKILLKKEPKIYF